MNKNGFYQLASIIWRKTILKWYRKAEQKGIEKYWDEHKKTCGIENKDKIFYVVRRRDVYCGLFSILITSLVRIDEALKHGYIPIIDMQNSMNIYLKKEEIEKVNAWEFYFRQPFDITLNDIKKSKNVIIGSGAVPQMFPYMDVDFLMGKDGEIEYWRQLAHDYIKLNNVAQNAVNDKYQELFSAEDRILGIKCRGTDYLNGKPKNHPVQPSVEQVLDKAKEMFKQYHCTKVFLATEDITYYRVLKEYFGDALVTNKVDFLEYHGGSAGREQYERGKNPFDEGMEYLVTTMLLARCNCLCAGRVSATVGALLFTEGYEAIYLFDLGMY